MVGSGGRLYVNEGASVSNTTVSDGYMEVYDHGKAYDTVINDGGLVFALKADLLDGTAINNGGEFFFQNYKIKDTTVNAGGVLFCEGKESSGLTVNLDGTLAFSGSDVVTLSGKNIFAGTVITQPGNISQDFGYGGGWNATVNVAGEVVFAIDQRETENDAIIDDISIFRNGSYSVTVSANQKEGRYALAGNASEFNTSVTVKDSSYKKLGTLSVGGNFSAKGYTYSLQRENGTLFLNVTGSGGIPPETETPGTITGLGCKVSKYNVSLSWDKSTVKNSSFEISINGVLAASTKSNKYTLKNVTVGNYQVQVRMVSADGVAGNWSKAVQFSVADITVPKLGKVSATVDGYTSVISWSGSDNVGVVRYEVHCADQVQTVTGTSAQFKNLAVGKYNAEVTAYDAAGNASKTGKVSITVKDATPPEKVTGLAVPVVDGKYKATLSWDTGVDNSGKVANYEIQLDDGKILKSSKTSINVSNLSVGEHSYKVRAVDKDRNVGEWSEVQTFTVKDMTAPNSVKAKATVNGYSVTFALSGKDNSGSVARYVVTCGDKSVETTTGTAVLSDFGVGKQTAYVVAYDAEGNASKETKVSFTVKDATPPEKVTGLAVPVVDGKYKATLSWDTGVDNSGKVANYEIQLDDGKILKSSKTSINVSNLSVGEHSYKVRAVDKDRNVGEWSEVQTFTVKDMTAPGSVSVKAKVEGNSLQLSWKTPKDNVGVTGYILKHGVNLEHTETLTANKLSFQIDGIAKGTYQYQLTAVDAEDNESKPKNGKATIKTELPMADLNLELPDFASLSGFDSDVQAMPELMDDPLAFCHTLELDAELKLSATEMLGQDDANKRSGTLFAVAS